MNEQTKLKLIASIFHEIEERCDATFVELDSGEYFLSCKEKEYSIKEIIDQLNEDFVI